MISQPKSNELEKLLGTGDFTLDEASSPPDYSSIKPERVMHQRDLSKPHYELMLTGDGVPYSINETPTMPQTPTNTQTCAQAMYSNVINFIEVWFPAIFLMAFIVLIIVMIVAHKIART